MWAPGDVVVHHEVWLGRVWAARPLFVVEDGPERLLLWMPEGTRRKVPVTPPGREDPPDLDTRINENLARGDWVHVDHEWDVSSLWILRPDDWHAVWCSWRDGAHFGWYVNLQRPYRRTAAGIEAMDLMLDVVVEPDLSWGWKDREQFDDLIARGVFDRTIADRVEAEAAAVIEQVEAVVGPFAEPWPSWRPDPAWGLPSLPPDWATVPA